MRSVAVLVGVLLLVGWEPGVQVNICCDSGTQVVRSDSLGLVVTEVMLCADTCTCVVTTVAGTVVPPIPTTLNHPTWSVRESESPTTKAGKEGKP